MPPFSLKSEDHLDDPARKRRFNEELFNEVAPRYDQITKLLSFWRETSWKRWLVGQLPAAESPICLDIASGTGDIAALLMQRYPGAYVAAVDLTRAMLLVARRRFSSGRIVWMQQDMMRLGLRSSSVDIVTGGYAIRNAPDLQATLAETARVLKPGGVAAFLDFSRPPGRFLWKVEYSLLKVWGSFWGILFHRSAEVYAYIAESLARFPDRESLRQELAEHGLSEAASRRFFFGVIEVIILKKQPL